MKKDRSKNRTQAYRERLTEKRAVAAEEADERFQCSKFDLRFFGESGFEQNAQTCQEEIHINRQFLRALSQPDVQEGETLRQLSKRTWDALLSYEFTSVDGDTAWIPMFNPTNQTFDGGPNPGHGYVVRGAMKSDWFETHWVQPKDCDGNEVIDRESLKSLPPMQQAKKPEPKLKPSPRVPPPVIDTPLVTGYETPLKEQNKSDGFGTFGVTQGF
jgi:hypothetical protein